MSKNAYVGVSGVARRASNIYVGVNGIARRVAAGYVGVNGIARQFYPQATTPTPDPEPDYPSNTAIAITASKCIKDRYSSLNKLNMDICTVGRAEYNYDGEANDSRAGCALQFHAPAAGWDYYTRAVLHFYRNGGTAFATVRIGKLNCSFDAPGGLGWLDFYYGRLNEQDFQKSFGSYPQWCEADITAFLPHASNELCVTMMSKYSYITIDGNPYSSTAPYIQLSR